MFIRSQDRNTLINESYFRIYKERKGFSICSRIDVLGTYSTEEKAMKVMDMIEDAILECECMRTGHAEYDFGAFVFDMPDDKDVEV